MSVKFSVIGSNDTATVSVVVNGDLYVADATHPNFNKIVEAAIAGNESVASMFDVADVIAKQFDTLSERVSLGDDRKVYFDNDVVDSALSDQIVRFLEQGEEFAPLVKFMENVYSNPNVHSREQLYNWLRDREFAITEDGNFLAYKGVTNDFESVHSGRAIVNGITTEGRIPNHIGNVITMPRSEVQFDPTIGCHTGLHAGTIEYASDFGDKVLIVEINPRDVVSVPTDCNAQKLRVSRYEVKDECAGIVRRAVVHGDGYYDEFSYHYSRIMDALWGDGEGSDDDEYDLDD